MTYDHSSDNDYWANLANDNWRDDNFWNQHLTTSSLSRQASWQYEPLEHHTRSEFRRSAVQTAVVIKPYYESSPPNLQQIPRENNFVPAAFFPSRDNWSTDIKTFYAEEQMRKTLSAKDSVASYQPRVIQHTPTVSLSRDTIFTAETTPVDSLTGTSTGLHTTLQATPIYSSTEQIGAEESAQESKSLTPEQDKQSLIRSLEESGATALWQKIMPPEFWEGDGPEYANNSQSRASIQTPLTPPIRNHTPEARQLPPRSQSYPVPPYYHPISAFTSHPAQNLLAQSLFTQPPILAVQQFNNHTSRLSYPESQSSTQSRPVRILRLSTEAFYEKNFDNTSVPLTGFANPDAQTSTPQAPKLLAKPPIKIDEKNPNSVTQKEEKSLTTSAPESTASEVEEKVLIPDPQNTLETKLDPTLELNTNPEKFNLSFSTLAQKLARELYKSFSSNSPEKNTKEVEVETAEVVAEVVTKRKPPVLIKEGLKATLPSNAPHPIETIHTASKQDALKRTPSSTDIAL